MSTMDSPTALLDALHNMSTNSLLLASKFSSTPSSLQAYLQAAADFKKDADNAHAMFKMAINSARKAMKGEDKENQDDQGESEDQGHSGGEDNGPPKRRLVLWSERIANQVEVRLKTQIVPEIQRGFRAYLENEVVPGIEDRVLSSLKQRVEEQKGFPTTHALDPPPYNALSVSPIQLQMAHEADGTPGCKRRCELALSLPGAEGPPGKRERLSES